MATDIYALGLSLYEALTGKNAYPPLPSGQDALYAFCKRAKDQIPPVFDSPVVTERPALLSLLEDMTNIDREKRIKDAAEVEWRIDEILRGLAAISDVSIVPDDEAHMKMAMTWLAGLLIVAVAVIVFKWIGCIG